jgi:hypothetical protein
MKRIVRLTEKDMHRLVRNVVKRSMNENLSCHEGLVRDMYEKLRNFEKFDCDDIRDYHKFKEAFGKSLDILEELLYGTHRDNERR